MRSMDTAGVTDDEWAAVRDVLAGVLPKSVRVEGMEKQAKAAAVQQMAGAIYTLQREVMAMMVGRWDAMRERLVALTADAAEQAEMDRDIRAAVAAREAEEARTEAARRAEAARVRREEEEQAQRAAAADEEVVRRATARADGAVAETRATRKRTAQYSAACAACQAGADNVCRSCARCVQELCEVCLGSDWVSGWCGKCARTVRYMCDGECVPTLRGMCGATCRRNAPEQALMAREAHARTPASRRRRTQTGCTTAVTVGIECRVRATAAAVADPARWRRMTTAAAGVELVEFDTDGGGTWEARFYIKRSEIAGRGLFAARPYAAGEYMTAYMGTDLGGVDTAVGRAMRAQLVRIQRADHVMAVNGRYVDGRATANGVQYINAGLRASSDNARFHSTGSVTARVNIDVGQEILYAYGASYWQQRAAERRRGL